MGLKLNLPSRHLEGGRMDSFEVESAMKNSSITVSAPCKVHLLGEWSVVWGKPALLTTVDLRVYVTISPSSHVIASDRRERGNLPNKMKKIIEPIIKKGLHLKKLPPCHLTINSEAPIGAGLGSSAAVSAAYIAALLTFLKVKWNLDLINKLSYEAEKVFHGNPSGADNSTIVYGGLMWYRKESPDLKIIQPLLFSIPHKLARNFVLINTGTPKLTTKQMIDKVTRFYKKSPAVVNKFLENQESLVKQLLPVLKTGDSALMIRIIRAAEKNLESIGVCSPSVRKIIRQIEKSGGAAKICGAGADSGPTGVLLCYHKNPAEIKNIANSYNLSYFKVALGVEGLRKENL